MRRIAVTATAVALLAGCAATRQEPATERPVRTGTFAGQYLDLAACSDTRLEELAGRRRVQLVDLGTQARVVVRTDAEVLSVYELVFTPSGDRVAVTLTGPERGAGEMLWREVETCARLGKW